MLIKYLKNNFSSRKTNLFLFCLIAFDIFFIIAHIIAAYLLFIDAQFDRSFLVKFFVENDNGYPEVFQYVKYILIIGAIIYTLFFKKEYNYISWLLLFILLLLDDSLSFHERFGQWAVERFNYSPLFGLRAQDLGELTYVAIFGSLILFTTAIGYLNGSKEFKRTSVDIGLLFSLFLFFGIVMDMLHSLLEHNRYTNLIMVLLEDGGEMITLSLLAWYFFYIMISPDNKNKFIYMIFTKK